MSGLVAALVLPPKLSGAFLPNRASRATIAFLESDRPDAPRAGDAYGDQAIAAIYAGRAIGSAREESSGSRPAEHLRWPRLTATGYVETLLLI